MSGGARQSAAVIALGLAVLAAVASAPAAGQGRADPPPCAAAATLRPTILQARSELDFGHAVATHPLRVTFGFDAATNGSHPTVDEDTPMKVSGPSGVRVAAGEDWYERIITAASAGAKTLALSWVQGTSNQCTGTGDVALQIGAAKPARVTFRFRPLGMIEMGVGRVQGGDASTLRVIVRGAGPKTLKPPKSGRPVLDRSVPMGEPAGRKSIKRSSRAASVSLEGYAGDYELDLQPNIRKAYGRAGKTTNFALAAVLFQSGRRVAWVSTGVHCHVSLLRYGGLRCFYRGLRKGH